MTPCGRNDTGKKSAIYDSVEYILSVMMMGAFACRGIKRSLADAVGHAQSQYGQGIPQAAHENDVRHIPHPFEYKRKHIFLLEAGTRSEVRGQRKSPSPLDLKPLTRFHSVGLSSCSCGNIGR